MILRRRILPVLVALVLTGCGGGDDGGSGDFGTIGTTPSEGTEPRPDRVSTTAGRHLDDEPAPPITTSTSTSASSGTGIDDLALSAPGDHVAVVADVGGDCPGGCVRLLELLTDGTWLLTDETGATLADGAYDAPALAALVSPVVTDPTSLSLGPFEGECPTVVDGHERLYRIHDPDDPSAVVVDLASCTDQVAADTDLIAVLDLLLVDAEREIDPSAGGE